MRDGAGAGTRGGPSFGERRLVEETRERFLKEIVARVPLGRLAAVHLFRPIRQGGFESGVAVIAAEPVVVEPVAAPPEPVMAGDVAEPNEVAETAEVADPIAEPACDPTDAAAGPAPVDTEPTVDAEPRPTRHTVFTARYRLAIKGPERGKWDVEVVEEADAPMVTVEAVVRGVQRRAGDEGDPPERLDAAAVARLVGVPGPGAAPP